MKKFLKTSTFLVLALTLLYSGLTMYFNPTQGQNKEMSKFVRRFINIKGMKTYGSGFNVKFMGKYFIITNRHVCNVSKHLGYKGFALVNGSLHRVLSVSKKHDLCALESNINDGYELAEEDTNTLDNVTLIGHPRGLDIVIRRGHVISKNNLVCVAGYEPEGIICYYSDMISCTTYGGNSGSPVFNKDMKVIGVLFAGSPAYPTEGYIVPHKYLKEFLIELTVKQ